MSLQGGYRDCQTPKSKIRAQQPSYDPKQYGPALEVRITKAISYLLARIAHVRDNGRTEEAVPLLCFKLRQYGHSEACQESSNNY